MSAVRLKHFGWGREGEGLTAEEEAFVMARAEARFTAFHPDWKMLDTPPTPPATLRSARRIGKQQGLRYVYTGNIHDPAGQSTCCHACDAPLIGRDWYDLTDWNLTTDGRCHGCGAACAGVFERTPGRWGRRRQVVRVPALA